MSLVDCKNKIRGDNNPSLITHKNTSKHIDTYINIINLTGCNISTRHAVSHHVACSMNDVGVNEWQSLISGDPACVWRKKKGCINLTYCNNEVHSEFAGAVINPGTNTRT